MCEKKEVTCVIFRMWHHEVIALFPYERADYRLSCESYMQIGQHSAAAYPYMIKQSRPATAEEFTELKRELENLGYDLKVIKRRNTMKTKRFHMQLFHIQLIRGKFFEAARLLLRGMLCGELKIVDRDNEAYESGLADWLQNTFRWRNERGGFRAYLSKR